MYRTQDHLPIVDVKENGVALMQNGDLAVVLETGAVNFGLLSANEQYAIISSFAGMLNSLSFSIQIVIRSKRLDITDYLKLLDKEHKKQMNPLLANMMLRYRSFIESTVRDNEVLDKQFYIVISMSYLELGVTRSSDDAFMKKASMLLMPRRDHIIRQLARIGLKATQLDHKQLVKLFYDIYNFDPKLPTDNQLADKARLATQEAAETAAATPPTPAAAPEPAPVVAPSPAPTPVTMEATVPIVPIAPVAPLAAPQVKQPQPIVQSQNQYDPALNNPALQNYSNVEPLGTPGANSGQRGKGSPFVVEELHDDYTRA